MPFYTLFGSITVPVHTILRARDIKEARRFGEAREIKPLCFQCNKSVYYENLEQWCLDDGLKGGEVVIQQIDPTKNPPRKP